MRDSILLVCLVLLQCAFLAPHVYCQDDEEARLEQSLKELEELISKKVDQELIALKNKIPYPPKDATMSFNDAYKAALNAAAKKMEEVEVKTNEELRAEVRAKYAPFEIGEQIKVTTSVSKNPKIITGRYQGKNQLGKVHIGGYWVLLRDFDEETAVRFDPEKCEAFIARKTMQAIAKQRTLLEKTERKTNLTVASKILREYGYFPINTDVAAPDYFDGSNWETAAGRLERLVDQEKEEIEEDFMTKRGFVYNAATGTWRVPPPPPPPPAPKKKGFWAKLKEMF